MQKFSPGDVVTVVDTPNYSCAFGWVPEMDRYCGRTAVVQKAYIPIGRKECGYRLDVDGGDWNWDEGSLLEPVPAVEETELIHLLLG